MWSPTLPETITIGLSLVPTALTAAIHAPQAHLSARNESEQLPGFPHPNPTKSYWQDPPHRIANLRSTPELPTDQVFDYVIIGSGITGAATAMKLLQRDSELSILMLEGRTAASGACFSEPLCYALACAAGRQIYCHFCSVLLALVCS